MINEIIAVACYEFIGAGFLFWGNENDYDVEPCSCVADDVDFTDFIVGA